MITSHAKIFTKYFYIMNLWSIQLD
uniref:Uncharacterized protein n=1 Tax=Arundo donax TaxID=35708 RepID=A0A0A9AK45_ARUDO